MGKERLRKVKRIYRVYKKTVSIVNETATGMYQNLVGKKKGFLLESYDKNYDRYTFFGAEPEEIISSEGNSLVITKRDGSREVREGNPLKRLKEYYNEFEIRKDNEELNFSGGLVGSVGYDFIRYTEQLPEENPDEIGIETVQFMLMKEFILVDYVAETLTAIVLESDDESGRQAAMGKAERMIAEAMKEQQESSLPLKQDGVIHCRNKAEGENTPGRQSLKGELLADEKERAEHVMLVDLARNDMGRISEFGTVKVTEFMKIRNYSHVMHIVSMVEGRKKGAFHPFDLLASFLPAGTLSGAPKIRAMEIIEELESVKRGLYGGATGYVDFSGDMDFCITIRTMIKKGRNVYLQAGAGIVADFLPENEYQECCNKVMALAKTLVEEENL